MKDVYALISLLEEKELTSSFQGVFGIDVVESMKHNDIVSLESEGFGVYKKGTVAFFLERLKDIQKGASASEVFYLVGNDGVLL